MKINIYYGGRKLIGDPTLYALKVIENVLSELNVEYERIELSEKKNVISTLPNTLKDADGIILASTVEWFSVGGYMLQFLDACWLYADKDVVSKIYMMPVVLSTTYGEKEGLNFLSSAWEVLGGNVTQGVSGYFADLSSFENNDNYKRLIEKSTEGLYRTINQKTVSLPSSNKVIINKATKIQNVDLTPQETEQLSKYASDDEYVKRQKEDIMELSQLFKHRLDGEPVVEETKYISDFKRIFKPVPGVNGVYKFKITEYAKPLIVTVNGTKIDCAYKDSEYADAEIQLKEEILKEVIASKTSFQRSFMNGKIKIKGDFSQINNLDKMFPFYDYNEM